MFGQGDRSCLLLLAALSSVALSGEATKGDIAKTTRQLDTTKPAVVLPNKDLAPQESKNGRSQSPTKRDIRKFDFDAEFANYLGLASQADTARYLAGDAESSYRVPTAFQGSPDRSHYPPLRLVPGSTPASFAYFTQIYPDEHSDGDIRIEHFSPVIHPFSSEREKFRYRDDSDKPEHYEKTKSNYYPKDEPLYEPPTSRSYFGRYSNKHKYPEEDDDYGVKAKKNPYRQSKGFAGYSAPDYKMGYRHVGMYHKFHEEDLYPKKTSSEWIPLKQSSKSRTKQNQDGDRNTHEYDPDGLHDADVTSEDFHVKSQHDDDVTRIKTNIQNDPPYSTNNFDLAEKKGPYTGTLKSKGTVHKGTDNYGRGYFSTAPLAELPFEPAQRVRKHKRRRKKKKEHHYHHYERPGYRSSPLTDDSTPITNPGQPSDFKAPSFEFHNPVTSYVSPPYTSPETHNSNLKVEPYTKQAEYYDSSKESHKPPLDSFRIEPGNDLPVTNEGDIAVPFDEPSDVSQEPADIDDEPIKPDDLDEDYHIISEAGPTEHTEHTKDFDKRLPQDDKVYGSFETFDSQLDSASNKKFEPFVQYPFDEQRKKLASVVEELIESGKSR